MNTVHARIAAACLLVASAYASAQQSDVADATGTAVAARRPFERVPERYPDCASAVQRYWDKTHEAQALAEQRAHAVDSQTNALTQKINDVAAQRTLSSDEIKDCVRASVTGEGRGSAGSVEHADLDNGIAKDEPIVLPPQTPQPAPRQTTIPPPGQSSAASQPVPEVRGAIVPQQQPGSAQAATGARSTASASVSGVVLPRNEPTGGTTDPSGDDRNNPTNPAGSTTRPPGTRTGGDATVVTDGSGELPAGAPTSGDANTRGTAPNDSTRSYFFSQGMLQGVNETGQELGGRLGQIMVATGYLLTGQPQRAKEWLDIDAGESVVWNSFVDDIDIWVEVFTGDPTDADSPRSFESGRNAGKTLTSLVAAKFGQSFRNVRDVSRSPPVDGLPQMPARNPGTPALVPPKSDATQDAVKPRATR